MSTVFDEGDIQRLERDLEITLPDAYRSVLLAYPFEVDSDPYQWDLFGNVETIIAENQENRDNGFFGQKWPRHYLIIGGDGTGGVYFLDLEEGQDRVFYSDHGATAYSNSLDVTEEAPSITAWVQRIAEEKEEFEREEAQREADRKREEEKAAERRQHKKWWQFWI